MEFLPAAIHCCAVQLDLVRVPEIEPLDNLIQSRDEVVKARFKYGNASKLKKCLVRISGRTRIVHIKDVHGQPPSRFDPETVRKCSRVGMTPSEPRNAALSTATPKLREICRSCKSPLALYPQATATGCPAVCSRGIAARPGDRANAERRVCRDRAAMPRADPRDQPKLPPGFSVTWTTRG